MNRVKLFAEEVTGVIRAYLPPEYQKVECEVLEKQKNNGVNLTGIIFKIPQESVAPVIYMDAFYNRVCMGDPVPEIMKEIADCYMESRNTRNIAEGLDYTDYRSVKNYVQPVLINTAANREMLMNMPHKQMEDLSLIYEIVLPKVNDDFRGSVKITHQLVKEWGIPEEDVHRTAIDNLSQKTTAELKSMDEILRETLMGKSEEGNFLSREIKSWEDAKEPMYVLTNTDRSYGAALLASPTVMDKVDDFFHGDFYILPSSVHEGATRFAA